MKRKGGLQLEYLKKLSPRFVIIFLLSIIGVYIILAYNAHLLYKTTKEDIVRAGKVNALQTAQVFNEYLQTGIDAVDLVAYTIEDMEQNGRSKEFIKKYLVETSKQYATAISGNYNGIYGVIGGCYLDGTGWDPDKSYDPTQRMWYTMAKANKGKTTLITPYKDAMTHELVMSVSKCLPDGDVIAMDMTLNTIRDINEGVYRRETGDNYFLIMDSNSEVIDIFGDYKRVGGIWENPDVIAKKVSKLRDKNNSNSFEISVDSKKYFVYVEKLQGQWYAVSVMDAKEMFVGLMHAQVFAGLLIAFFIVVALIVFFNMNRRQVETEEMNLHLASIADIYSTMYVVNLKANRIAEVSKGKEDIGNLVTGKHNHADMLLQGMMEFYCDEEGKADMKEFVQFPNIISGLENTNTITKEFLNHNDCWCRGRFVVVERKDGKPSKVMWMIEKIDEERRQRDHLQYLSEIDRMTGILNRGSGEVKIRSILEEKTGGMFVLFDVDHFKAINDTYGHGVGDRVIVEIANAMKMMATGDDIVMRLGGDEFAAFVPELNEREEGKKRIEQFMERVRNIDIQEFDEKMIEVSIGVVFCSKGQSITFEELYKNADRCTYISKKQAGSIATFWD